MLRVLYGLGASQCIAAIWVKLLVYRAGVHDEAVDKSE